jgi:DNA-binding NtrC family response regulator
MPNVLVVDDEPQRTAYLKKELKGTDNDAYKIEQVTCWNELEKKLNREYQRLQLVIFDVDFSQLSGRNRGFVSPGAS